MKKIVLVVAVLALYSSKGYSQNLVPNYSFEDSLSYFTCPYVSSDALKCAPQWFTPGGGGEYLRETWGGFYDGVPNSSYGYQYPYSGVAMTMIEGNVYFNSLNRSEWQYLETPLGGSLIAGKKYCVSFYISLGESSIYGIDCIGAYFSQDSIMPPPSPSYSRIDVIPQVENPKYHFLVDTVNWMEISGSFMAQGGERFITIGNFRPDSLTDTARIKPIFGGSWYYFIDVVSVVAMNEDTANAGNDTVICQGDSVLLGSPAIANYIYSWSPSAGLDDSTKAQPLASPSVTTTYLLSITTTDTTYAPLCRSSVVIPDSVTITVRDCNPAFTNKLYPNPNNGNFQLDYFLGTNETGKLIIYDILGNQISSYILQQGKNILQIKEQSLENGVYLYRIYINDSEVNTDKLVIIK